MYACARACVCVCVCVCVCDGVGEWPERPSWAQGGARGYVSSVLLVYPILLKIRLKKKIFIMIRLNF